MVGLVQKILLDLIESSGGANAVCDVRRRAGIPEDKTFRMDEDYDE